MPHPIDPLHLAKANLRMRVSGQTRFHQSISESYNQQRTEWIKQPNCPFNRRDREHVHPLTTATQQLVAEFKSHPNNLTEMPSWWQGIYPLDTREDWIRKETQQNEKSLAEMWQVFDACLAHVNWNDWKGADVESILETIHLFGFEDDKRELLMDRLLDSGLPVDKLRHMGNPITPAMWSVLKNSYRRDLDSWIKRDNPLDPPGNTPGILAVIVLHWKSLKHSYAERLEDFVDKAIERGARVDLPTCTEEWKPEKKNSVDRLLYPTDYLSATTLIGQAHGLDSPRLLTALTSHQHVSDEARIESVRVLMKKTGDACKKNNVDAKTTAQKKEYLEQLERMLSQSPTHVKQWKKASKALLDSYFTQLWAKISSKDEPLVEECFDRLITLGVDPKTPIDPTTWKRSADTMEYSMTAPQARHAMIPTRGALLTIDVDTQAMVSAMVPAWIKSIVYDSGHGRDRTLKMVQNALSLAPLNDESSREVGKILTSHSKGGIGAAQLRHLLDNLYVCGWRFGKGAWIMLHSRLIDDSQHDSAEILFLLIERVARDQPPAYIDIFRPPGMHKTVKEDGSFGYRDICDWNREEAQTAHFQLVSAACQRLDDINSTSWNNEGVSALQGLCMAMEKEGPEQHSHLTRIASLLLDMGADPAMEPNVDPLDRGPSWSDAINHKSAFYQAWTNLLHEKLTQRTDHAPGGPRQRRF